MSLDARYHALLADLLSREVWDKEEFSTLVRRYGMMPAAALGKSTPGRTSTWVIS